MLVNLLFYPHLTTQYVPWKKFKINLFLSSKLETSSRTVALWDFIFGHNATCTCTDPVTQKTDSRFKIFISLWRWFSPLFRMGLSNIFYFSNILDIFLHRNSIYFTHLLSAIRIDNFVPMQCWLLLFQSGTLWAPSWTPVHGAWMISLFIWVVGI
jgi:hypothetical protein